MKKENIIVDMSFEFALRIVKLYDYLCKEKKEFILSRQVMRSGTSIGANIEEAQGAQSTKDFISKLSIAFKEARETRYWLKLLYKSDYLTLKQYESLLDDCNQMINIISSILLTTKTKS